MHTVAFRVLFCTAGTVCASCHVNQFSFFPYHGKLSGSRACLPGGMHSRRVNRLLPNYLCSTLCLIQRCIFFLFLSMLSAVDVAAHCSWSWYHSGGGVHCPHVTNQPRLILSFRHICCPQHLGRDTGISVCVLTTHAIGVRARHSAVYGRQLNRVSSAPMR